ncbi:lactococcin 972 family bacteriocin [Streptomyces sp. RY43-2]|uniref:Lactococcin 972 family bacteriocin n=1 Tax=Streptomyces macrolidinus TaxID=2952607 RepID=A0ABT0Z6S7_9ACTN|nr:lactococcin 972 family bacteriocin [Streptomyces macrolidinus]MCN9239469.1 lactococcin 972 family bacteriocin [Streptomyces macrolidinus]
MAATGALSTAGSAAASQSQVHVATYKSTEGAPPEFLLGPNGEVPTEWGVATFPTDVEFDSDSMITPKVSKGGGTWNYGTGMDGAYKGCYSNYIHPTKKHSASVAIAANTDKDIRNADIWAKAYATAGVAYTCNAYWGVY